MWFMVLTCSVEAVVCVQTYCSGQLIARILSEEVTGSSLMVKYDIGERGYCYFVTIVCVLVISLIVAVSNGFLLLFHLFLRIRRLTTYDYLQSLAHNNKIHPLKYAKNTGATTLNDSRAILCREKSNTEWEAIPLTIDHKPDVESEKERILSFGGRIDT